MLNLTTLLIEPFVRRLQHTYHQTYGRLEPDYPGILGWAARMALEHIAASDALYHTVEHTILVTLVGQDILIGKHYHDGGVTPRDWLHVMVALLLALAIVWGFSVVADSAQFSALVSEFSPRTHVGTALTLQTCVGFLLTMASMRLVPELAARFGWQWVFAVLAPGPVLGAIAMRRLRSGGAGQP